MNTNLTGGSLKYAYNGATYNGSNAMIIHMFDTELNNFNNFVNDLKVRKSIGKADLTFGYFKSNQNQNLGTHSCTPKGSLGREVCESVAPWNPNELDFTIHITSEQSDRPFGPSTFRCARMLTPLPGGDREEPVCGLHPRPQVLYYLQIDT